MKTRKSNNRKRLKRRKRRRLNPTISRIPHHSQHLKTPLSLQNRFLKPMKIRKPQMRTRTDSNQIKYRTILTISTDKTMWKEFSRQRQMLKKMSDQCEFILFVRLHIEFVYN